MRLAILIYIAIILFFNIDSKAQSPESPTSFWKEFKAALNLGDEEKLKTMIHIPLLRCFKFDSKCDSVSKNEIGIGLDKFFDYYFIGEINLITEIDSAAHLDKEDLKRLGFSNEALVYYATVDNWNYPVTDLYFTLTDGSIKLAAIDSHE